MKPLAEAETLRQAAEARLKAGLAAPAGMAATDATRLLHELQVHQVELELQNRELREARAELEAALGRYTELYESAPVAYFTLDRRGTILQHNPIARKLLGVPSATLIGQPLHKFVASEDLVGLITLLADCVRQRGRTSRDLAMINPAAPGQRVYVHLEVANHPQDETFRVAVADISDRKAAEEARQRSEAKFHALYAAMIEGVALHELVFDAEGHPVDYVLLEVNPAFESILNLSREAVLGRRASEVYGVSPAPYLSKYANVAMTGVPTAFEARFEPMGKLFSISVFAPARNQFAVVFADITEQSLLQQRLEHSAHFDALTDLPNRTLLADRLRQAMAWAHRHGQSVAVAYIDLDGFKSINDRHGHAVGDQLLVALARGMQRALREEDTLARLGGDEFVAVMIDLPRVESNVPMLGRLLDAVAEPVQIGGLSLKVSASIGVSFYPQADEVDADQLMRQADQAMYKAKLAGKDRYQIFDPAEDQSARIHHEYLGRIQQGLASDEFVLHYQPKVNLRTGRVIGAEALIRWQHPERGLLLPAAFLPTIEEHPLAVALGEWVIDQALTQMAHWLALGLDLPVSVNIGARQLQQADFIERLRDLLAQHPGIKPGRLELEVLETSALQDVAQASDVINACRALGVNVALDDFGTGYSSLTYLKRLPAETLKIDQSFVRDMYADPEALAILEGVLGLASAFRRQPIAEGVETVETGVMLRHMGCELAQGFAIARPMPAEAMPGWVMIWQPDPRWVAASVVTPGQRPLIYAAVEHRAWVATIEAILQGERVSVPPLDSERCRLGVWLTAERQSGLLTPRDHQILSDLHRRGHAVAGELLAWHERGAIEAEIKPRLLELYGLRDCLLEHLHSLITPEG